MPTAWRIVKSRQTATAFDGEGARLHGGRWNSPGTSMVYTAESRSLAALELLVHLQRSALLVAYSTIPVEFAGRLVETVDPALLPRGWQRSPGPSALQIMGDRWITEGRSVALRVPSAIIPDEWNYLVNPRHADFRKVRPSEPEPFRFDWRLRL